MRKYPEVFALLFLALAWAAASTFTPSRAEVNRVMVLKAPVDAGFGAFSDCPAENLGRFGVGFRERLRTEVRGPIRNEFRDAVQDLKEALRNLK